MFPQLEKLTRKMLRMWRDGDLTEEEYAAFKVLLDWLEFSRSRIGDRLPIRDARDILEGLK